MTRQNLLGTVSHLHVPTNSSNYGRAQRQTTFIWATICAAA
jgi:hypothetical protein